MRNPSIAAGAVSASRWGVIALGLSIPISVALDNILLLAIAVAWLVAGNYRETFTVIRKNPVAQAMLALFGLLIIGLAYGSRNPGDGLSTLVKYKELLFVPLFLISFRDTKTRERALFAFALAAVVSIIASHVSYVHTLMQDSPALRAVNYWPGFKSSITHNLIVGFAAFLFAVLAREEKNRTRRIGLVVLALLAMHNVMFMVIGRTGQLVLLVLFLYFFLVTLGPRGILFFLLAATAALSTAYTTSDTFRDRVYETVEEVVEWTPGQPSRTSIGLRLEFYHTSLRIIRDHPLVGSGTGSVEAVYARAVSGQNMKVARNPHNEYLLIAIQVGLVGLAVLLHLFYRQWQVAGRLAQPLYHDLARGMVLMFAVGCLFNSLLLDHTEGLLFAWMSALLFSARDKSASSP